MTTPIYKAFQQILLSQFEKPEWLSLAKNNMFAEWELKPDGFLSEHSITIEFEMSDGTIRVTINNDLIKPSFKYHHISWADPKADRKILTIMKNWMIYLWKEGQLGEVGYPNPASQFKPKRK